MFSFYYEELCSKGEVVVTGDSFHHLARVGRVKVADSLFLTNGRGLTAKASVTAISKKELTLKVEKVDEVEDTREDLILCLGLPKKDYLSSCLRSVCEFQLKKLVIMQTEYSNGPLPKKDRIRSILTQALEQTKGAYMPEFVFSSFDEAIKSSSGRAIVLLDQNGTSTGLNQKNFVSAFIGPEGGFSPRELEQLEQQKIQKISLSPSILRTVTAVPAFLGAFRAQS